MNDNDNPYSEWLKPAHLRLTTVFCCTLELDHSLLLPLNTVWSDFLLYMWRLLTLLFDYKKNTCSSGSMESCSFGHIAVDRVENVTAIYILSEISAGPLPFGRIVHQHTLLWFMVCYASALVGTPVQNKVLLCAVDPGLSLWLHTVLVKTVDTLAPASVDWCRMRGCEACECVLNMLS